MAIIDGLKRRILNLAFFQEALRTAYREGLGDGNDEKIFQGYRSLGGTIRDLTSYDQDKAMDVSFSTWQESPMARRIVALITDFVVGEGMRPDCPHPDVQKICKTFWIANKWDTRLPKYVSELAIFGEQLWEAFVNPMSGEVRMGAIDPSHIDTVITDAENIEDRRAVQLKPTSPGKTGRVLRLISLDQDGHLPAELQDRTLKVRTEANAPLSPRWGQIEGAAVREMGGQRLLEAAAAETFRVDGIAFLLQVNDISVGTRGRPDMLSLLDWLQLYGNLPFDLAERAALISAFLYHVQIANAQPGDVEKRAKELARAPKPGSIIVSNDKEAWTALSPNLGAQDIEAFVRVLRVMIAGGAGFPESWFAEGSATNRATLLGQNVPTLKSLAARQRFIVAALTEVLRFVVAQAVAHNMLPEILPVLDSAGNEMMDAITGEDLTQAAVDAVHISVPDLDVKDMQVVSGTLSAIATALIALRTAKLVPQKIAVQVLTVILTQFGIEMSAEEIMDLLNAEPDATGLLPGEDEESPLPGEEPPSPDEEPPFPGEDAAAPEDETVPSAEAEAWLKIAMAGL